MPSEALAAVLNGRYAADFSWRYLPDGKDEAESLPTGLPEIDSLTGGLPRGGITEITGPVSSGRTSVLDAALARATADGESCALVDCDDRFDPASAETAGVRLERLVWVRCGGNTEHALRAADLLLQGGGFGFIAFDLGDTPSRTARRISLTSWYRFRRAIENTRTVMVVVGLEPYARQCASLALEVRRGRTVWTGSPQGAQLLTGMEIQVERRKPAGKAAHAAVEVPAFAA